MKQGSIFVEFLAFPAKIDHFLEAFAHIQRKLKTKFSDNEGKNTWRLFHILEQFSLNTSEKKLDYYNQKVNIRISSRVAQRLKI